MVGLDPAFRITPRSRDHDDIDQPIYDPVGIRPACGGARDVVAEVVRVEGITPASAGTTSARTLH
jgi:hypothetical protein